MNLTERIDAVMRAATTPLSARAVHTMMPAGTNLATVGTLLTTRKRQGYLTTLVIAGTVCYRRAVRPADEPLHFDENQAMAAARMAPARRSRVGDVHTAPQVLIEFVRGGAVLAGVALDALIGNRAPQPLLALLGDATKALNEAHYQLTLTVDVGAAP